MIFDKATIFSWQNIKNISRLGIDVFKGHPPTGVEYCGPIAPSGRILAPPNADRNPMRAEDAPL